MSVAQAPRWRKEVLVAYGCSSEARMAPLNSMSGGQPGAQRGTASFSRRPSKQDITSPLEAATLAARTLRSCVRSRPVPNGLRNVEAMLVEDAGQ